jgi:acetyl esterase/lipase
LKTIFFTFLCMLAVNPLLVGAQTGPPIDPALGISTLPLWPKESPQVAGTDPADLPTLTLFLPQKGKGTGSAVIVAPGGAYVGLATNLEGRQVADWFTARGVTAFVLKYRLGAKYLYPIPLEDAQRAVRLVRSLASEYGFAPDRIGFVGFSAGGHLAAATGTLFAGGKSDSADPVERLSSRPDFLVLGYPWLNAMQPSGNYITYCSKIKILPPETCKLDEQKYTPSLHVTPQTPTTFIYSTTDDQTVPISASVNFYNALIAAGVPAELHIFRHGAHGSGMGAGIAALDLWPVLLEQWLRDQGLLTPIPKP